MLPKEKISYYLSYKDSGNLYWRNPKSKKVKPGQQAGSTCGEYRQITIEGKRYLEHILVWILHTGKPPSSLIDHIDGNRSNNKISNLRESGSLTNQYNRKSSRGSSSKYKGVYWNKGSSKWHTQARKNGKRVSLGFFTEEEDAAKAYDIFTKDFHRDFHKPNL